MAEDTEAFAGYSFRTSSRFGSYVEIVVADGVVTVTGRRVARWARDAWIGAQGGLMGAAVAAFVDMLFGVRGARRRLLRALFWEWLVASFGALLVWWPSERGPRGLLHGSDPERRAEGTERSRRTYSSWPFRVSQVRDVRVSRWYWRRWLWTIAWPWNLLIAIGPDRRDVVVFDVRDANGASMRPVNSTGETAQTIGYVTPWRVTHGANWKTTHGMGDLKTCQGCHATATFCASCHHVVIPHAENYLAVHGPEVLSRANGRTDCLVCHRVYSCDNCHGLPMPHPNDFLKQHSSYVKKNGRTVCSRCHDESSCTNCHTRHTHPGLDPNYLKQLQARPVNVP